jgi:hypothetical protein
MASEFGSRHPDPRSRIDRGSDLLRDGPVPDADGEEADYGEAAATDEAGRPVQNQTRNLTATALTTALNTAFLSDRIALFAIVMGVALLLTGIGFLVLTIGALRPAASPTA